jgi:hypothetical protein
MRVFPIEAMGGGGIRSGRVMKKVEQLYVDSTNFEIEAGSGQLSLWEQYPSDEATDVSCSDSEMYQLLGR